MDKMYYQELVSNLKLLIEENAIQEKNIFLFGHCNATQVLVDLLLERELSVKGILDNNPSKQGNMYKNIPVITPECILEEKQENTIVCIVARAYAAMVEQLEKMGYRGSIRKLVDYNSYAEYSLSEDTIYRMEMRAVRGAQKYLRLQHTYSDSFFVLCPFAALGDIYYMMSYLPYYLKMRRINKLIICVIGGACAQVVALFGNYSIEIMTQKDMDETIQGALYLGVDNFFVAHQDRPYVVDLHKAIYSNRITLEQMYCCGVFGLPWGTVPVEPMMFHEYTSCEKISEGKSVILSPYAKSVTALDAEIWAKIVYYFANKGYQCFTNVVGDEVPLQGTLPISPRIAEIKSVVERAGCFIGIRSGLCDVLKTANARKIALYPDYRYCDTQWKSIDMYKLEGWENKEV